MKIALSVETTADLPKELLKKYGLFLIPFIVLLGEEPYQDGEITNTEIFEFVERTNILPRTSAVNFFQYKEHFTKILAEKYDAIIHLCLSSEMSCSYGNAEKASQEFKDVYAIDSRSLSTGISLLAVYARELLDKGLGVKEIVEKVKARIPFVQASFVIHTLDYLHKGGRCSGLALISAAILRIKPQILVIDGKMIPGKKFFGRRNSVIEQYAKDVFEQNPNPDLNLAFVTHTQATPEMVEIAKDACIKRGFKTIIETQAGATITSHCGPLTLGILFVNKQSE